MPTPLQEAGASALRMPEQYYRQLAEDYRERRDLMLEVLGAAGQRPIKPAGASHVLADTAAPGWPDDVAAAGMLVRQARVVISQ